MTPAGFPHSEIPGSKLVCSSPGLIAAYRVLHRLLVPRHPPCALSSLTGILTKVHRMIAQRLVFDGQRSSATGGRGRGVAARGGGPRARSIEVAPRAGGATFSRFWWR